MNATKVQLIDFLEKKVLIPVENNPKVIDIIRRKIQGTRMRLNNQHSSEKVEEFFWSAMATERGIDSYTKIKQIGGSTFEDVRAEFKVLC